MSASNRPEKTTQTRRGSKVGDVRRILQFYADAGLFAAFTVTQSARTIGIFAMTWRYLPRATLTVDVEAEEFTLLHVLPRVSSRSPMGRSYRQFLINLSAADRPSHRRIDSSKVKMASKATRGGLALRFRVTDRDYDYATRAFVRVLQESIYEFLLDGPYYDYRVQKLGFDPDRVTLL
jgi:hypothetical protein